MSQAPFCAGLFRFDLTVTDDMALPPYKGFTFRGIFGASLRKLACLLPNGKCPGCPFKHTCVYAYLFETSPREGSDGFRRFSDFPRPYIIRPPLGAKRMFRQNDTMSFEFVLIGRGNRFLPHIILAFEEIGKRGIRNRQGRFMIDRVMASDASGEERIVYEKGYLKCSEIPFRYISLQQAEKTDVTGATLLFHTPLLLEDHGKIQFGPPRFAFLFENLARRITLLHALHGDGEADGGQMEKLLEQAGKIEIKATNMRWKGMERISNRQHARIKTGGLIGRVSYGGDLTPFVPYLRAGELLHIGKSTTFGFGGYRLHVY